METAFDDPANDHCGHDQRSSGAGGHFDLYLRLSHRSAARAYSLDTASKRFRNARPAAEEHCEDLRWH